ANFETLNGFDDKRYAKLLRPQQDLPITTIQTILVKTYSLSLDNIRSSISIDMFSAAPTAKM
ncbi:hypothetical protein NQ317_000373, partial [Molorchus minor]